jgi:transcriptional regulator with XRE-family HTH domain
METRLSQQELARKVGVTQQYISCITNGKRTPSAAVAALLEQATGVRREAWIWPHLFWNPYIVGSGKEGRKNEKQPTQ